MARPTSPTAKRPCFDLSEDDLRALSALPPPYPESRDERIRAVLAAWWTRTDRPDLVVPTERRVTRPVPVRLGARALRRLDRERGEATRGAWLRAVVDVSARKD
jgi:hypothetical protein